MDAQNKQILVNTELVDQYREYLLRIGYATKYVDQLVRSLPTVRKHLDDIQFLNLLYSDNIRGFLEAKIGTLYDYNSLKKIVMGVNRFQKFLILKSVMEAPPKSHIAVNSDPIFMAFERYLIEEKRYCKKNRKAILRTFRQIRSYIIDLGYSDVSELDEIILVKFLSKRKVVKSYATTLRILLKFLYREGYVSKNLSHLVMSVRGKRDPIKRYISPCNVNQLLKVIPRSTIKEKRNYAMILMMARLGLRVCEVRRLRMSDLDWVRARVKISGKLGKVALLPLTQDTGDAIIEYLRSSTRGVSEYVFVSTKPEFKKISSAKFLLPVLADAYFQTGIKCPTKKNHLNVFRHSFATEMLNRGVPILGVRDLLRHESVDVTLNYAKHNIVSLRTLSMPWPRKES